ncbi:MAG: DsbA family protein [Fervidobacterium sp.]
MAKKHLSKKEKKRLKYLESMKETSKGDIVEEKKSGKPPKVSKKWIILGLVFLLIIGYVYYVNANKPTYIPIKAGDPFVGVANASVTITEFSDFQCTYCANFHKTTYPEIKDKFIDTGKVKFVFKDFPIEQIHPLSMKAAEAARCAYEQDKYEDYAILLFNKQNEWTRIGVSKLKDYAKELGLDTNSFNRCLDSGAMRNAIKQNFDEGKKMSVTGTPTFFVNDKRITGARPFSDFEKVINEELSK